MRLGGHLVKRDTIRKSPWYHAGKETSHPWCSRSHANIRRSTRLRLLDRVLAPYPNATRMVNAKQNADWVSSVHRGQEISRARSCLISEVVGMYGSILELRAFQLRLSSPVGREVEAIGSRGLIPEMYLSGSHRGMLEVITVGSKVKCKDTKKTVMV